MRAPSWTVSSATSCLVVTVLLVFGAFRVHSLPCAHRGTAQLAKIVCFIAASSEHYDYESLRTGLCSHIVLIDLMGVGKDGSLELLQPSSRALNRFIETKRRFRAAGDQARFIISVGGVVQKSSHFSRALKTIESRYALSDELISFVIKHELNGIDIAWFYPAQFGGAESDRTNLAVFLRELYLRTKACGISLSLTVGVDPKDIELSYDVPRINEAVDFVNLLAGDYHNPTSPTHISPLYGQGQKDRLNINYSVMAYIEAGLNPQKIVIMASCYAYLYVSKINKINSPCPAKLKTVMRLSYLSARELITRESFQTSWDDMRQVPYGTLSKGTTKKWITYSDAESIKRKAEYVLYYQLGGMGIFSIDEDDYGGRAGCGRYPILRSIVAIIYPELDCSEEDLNKDDVETIICPYNGFLADPVEPECYYVCEQGINLRECPKQCCPQGESFCGAQSAYYQSVPIQPYPMSTCCCPSPQRPKIDGPDFYPAFESYPQPIMPNAADYTRQCACGNAPMKQPSVIHQVVPPTPLSCQPATAATNPPGCGYGQYPTNGVYPSIMASSSTISPIYSSIDEPLHQASNLVPQIMITPKPFEHPALQNMNVGVQVIENGNPYINEPHQITEPSLLITPKPFKQPVLQNTNVGVQVIENGSPYVDELHQVTEPSVLITPKPFEQPIVQNTSVTDGVQVVENANPHDSELHQTTEASVLITPKVNYLRTSKKRVTTLSRKRKSRTKYPTSSSTDSTVYYATTPNITSTKLTTLAESLSPVTPTTAMVTTVLPSKATATAIRLSAPQTTTYRTVPSTELATATTASTSTTSTVTTTLNTSVSPNVTTSTTAPTSAPTTGSTLRLTATAVSSLANSTLDNAPILLQTTVT